MLFGCLVVLEVSLLRFLTIFVWKRMPPLNPDFYTRFGNIANFLASLFLANMSSYSKPGMGIELQLIGGNPDLVLDPALDLRYMTKKISKFFAESSVITKNSGLCKKKTTQDLKNLYRLFFVFSDYQ